MLENDRPGAGRFWRVESLELRIATASVRTGLAMTGFLQEVQYGIGGRTEASGPTEGYKGCDGAGRCGHRPLRTVTWGAAQRATARVAPTDVLQGVRWDGRP